MGTERSDGYKRALYAPELEEEAALEPDKTPVFEVAAQSIPTIVVTDIDPESRPQAWKIFIDSIIEVESSGDPAAESPAGARGLMQIMPATWGDMTGSSFDNAFDPRMNRMVGGKYLRWIVNALKARGAKHGMRDVLACYNGGLGRYAGNGYDLEKMPAETRAYVDKVMTVYARKLQE